jgi:hypothetical protein
MAAMEHFSLPGFDVGELLGFGSTGEVWRAVDIATGEQVALKRLHGPFEPLTAEPGGQLSPAAEELRREAALLSSVRHEHVVALRSVVPTSSGLVLVLDYAAGGSLAALLAVRGRLSGGEVVTIGAPLAQALAEVHERGLVHGDITPANVLFTTEGKPLLADLGVGSLAGERAPIRGMTPEFTDPAVAAAVLSSLSPGAEAVAAPLATKAGDVYGLAACCYAALSPAAPAALRSAIETALQPDPLRRPDAAAFSRALFAACAPEPVRLVEGQVGAPAPSPTHRVAAQVGITAGPAVSAERSARRQGGAGRSVRSVLSVRSVRSVRDGHQLIGRLAMGALAVALLAGAVAGGVMWASHGSRAVADESAVASTGAPAVVPPAGSGSPGPASTDWMLVLSALDSRRDRAFIDADAADLAAVYAPGSEALAADRATLARLVSAGVHADGLGLRLLSVTRAGVPAAGGPVSLLVHDVLPAYRLAGPGNASVPVAGRAERVWTVQLRWGGGVAGWQIESVTAS